MGPEAKAAHTIRRRMIRIILGSTLFRSERITGSQTNSLSDFENKINDGYGGIIVLKHFSLKDPPQIFKDIILSNPVLIQKEVVVPNATHQIYPGVPKFGELLGIKVDPIVTEKTIERAIEKGKPLPKLSEGSEEFVRDAVDYLKRGQLVAIAPEATRRPNLEPYGKNSIGVLIGAAHRARANVAVIFIDVRIAGQSNEYWKRNGFNPLAKYETRIGRCLTGSEIIAMAGGKLRDIDEKVILPEMRLTAAIKS